MKKNASYYIGNFLIIFSLIGFLYIFYPLVAIYIFPPKITSVEGRKESYLTIKKINAQSVISENIDPFNKQEYQKALKSSVAHAKGSFLPGESGTIFIFAHSSGPPWEQTRQNTIFLRLNELLPGDSIEIQKMKKKYNFVVREKKEVNPGDVEYIKRNEKSQLILQTCTPIGTDLKRLLVFADPV